MLFVAAFLIIIQFVAAIALLAALGTLVWAVAKHLIESRSAARQATAIKAERVHGAGPVLSR